RAAMRSSSRPSRKTRRSSRRAEPPWERVHPRGSGLKARLPMLRRQARALGVTEAAHQVIVHHPGGLHVRVDDRAPDELEAALLEILAERVRLLRRRRTPTQRAA